MTVYTAQNRNQTKEAREKQVKLMTSTMFEAVDQGDEALFDLAIKKGAETKAKDKQGNPLLHVAFRRAAADRATKWVDKVLPYVDDLFVAETSRNYTIFDAQLRHYFNPNATTAVDNYLPILRRHLLSQMPDIGTPVSEKPIEGTAPILSVPSPTAPPPSPPAAADDHQPDVPKGPVV